MNGEIIRFSVVLPGMDSDAKRTDFRPVSEHDGLVERYKGKNLEVATAIIFSTLSNCAGNPGAAE